jgi:hypothetical protein
MTVWMVIQGNVVNVEILAFKAHPVRKDHPAHLGNLALLVLRVVSTTQMNQELHNNAAGFPVALQYRIANNGNI